MQRLRYFLGLATIALTVALGVVFARWTRRGEEAALRLQVEFRDAGGLRAGGSVRMRGVDVGRVESVRLRADGQAAIVDLALEADGAAFARRGAVFWVVRPRVGGLTKPVDGLDTLIRDPYVTFECPDRSAPLLPDRATILGSESPADGAPVLPTIGSEDLLMTLVAPDAEGLGPGSVVKHRGLTVGEVREISLAPEGGAVGLRLRIDAGSRRAVTDSTRFWVARPRVQGSLLSGLELSDLSAVLVPFVAFETPVDSGLPVPDGHRAVAVDGPSEISKAFEASAVDRPVSTTANAADPYPLHFVEVLYEAEESDLLNANDFMRRSGTGLLYHAKDGSSVVLTTRSACDAAFALEDWIGEVDIEWETLRVVTPSGRVLLASRRWVAPDGIDLAVLAVEFVEGEFTKRDALSLKGDPHKASKLAERGGAVLGLDGAHAKGLLDDLDSGVLGAALLDGSGRVVGLIGAEDDQWLKVDLDSLPEDQLPRR